ncbi:hypothetical protein D917_04543 [Trichinella nativa]|uniref:Uncharacterized protein n=1 Tax=Trichinella nativa TaxID=6335 RepID=A0A1Y3E421_9BILA|nr:hypothetical protein D917_04543 [Trichinella nativa]
MKQIAVKGFTEQGTEETTSFRPDCRNHVDNCCKAFPVKEAPLPLPPQHSLAPTLMTNLADLIVTALNNKPVSKATHYVNSSSNIVRWCKFYSFLQSKQLAFYLCKKRPTVSVVDGMLCNNR